MVDGVTRIPPGPGQELVWDYPRPPRVEPVPERLRVVVGGEVAGRDEPRLPGPRDGRRAGLLLPARGRPDGSPGGRARTTRSASGRATPRTTSTCHDGREHRQRRLDLPGSERPATRCCATTSPSTRDASTRRGSATSGRRRSRATSTAAGSRHGSSGRSRASRARPAGRPAVGGDALSRRSGRPTMLNPPSTYSTSPVTALDRSEARYRALRPTSSMVMLARSGAISANAPVHPLEARDAGRREGPHRAGADGVDPDAGRTEVGREIPDATPPGRPWPRPSRCSWRPPSRRRSRSASGPPSRGMQRRAPHASARPASRRTRPARARTRRARCPRSRPRGPRAWRRPGRGRGCPAVVRRSRARRRASISRPTGRRRAPRNRADDSASGRTRFSMRISAD